MNSLPERTVMDLMAYADGELEGEERARVEAMLREDPAAQNALAEL